MNRTRTAAVLAFSCPALLASCQAATIVIGSGLNRGINSALDAEPRANTSAPQKVDRPAFWFQFPGDVSPLAGTWHLDTSRVDYDPDHKFFVETARRRGFIMFSIADGEKNPKSLLETLVCTMTGEEFRDLKRTAFPKWGQYHGEGAVISGKYRRSWNSNDVSFVSSIIVFLEAHRTYAIMEWIPEDDRKAAAPGFRLVETTFQVKGADASNQEERTPQRQAALLPGPLAPTGSVEPHLPSPAQPDCPACPAGAVCQSGHCDPADSPSCPVGMLSCREGNCVSVGPGQFANPIFGPDPEEAAARARNRMRPKLSIDPEVVVGLMTHGVDLVVSPAGLLMVAYRQNYLPWFGLRLRGGPLLGIAAYSASDDNSSCYGSQCNNGGGTTRTTRMIGGMVEAVPFLGPFGPVIFGPVLWAAYLNFGSNTLNSGSEAGPLNSRVTGGIGAQCGLLFGRRETTVLSFSVRGTTDSQTVFMAIGLSFQL